MRSSKTCRKYVCFAIWGHKHRIITPLKLKSVHRDNMKIKRDFSRIWEYLEKKISVSDSWKNKDCFKISILLNFPQILLRQSLAKQRKPGFFWMCSYSKSILSDIVTFWLLCVTFERKPRCFLFNLKEKYCRNLQTDTPRPTKCHIEKIARNDRFHRFLQFRNTLPLPFGFQGYTACL